MENKNNSLVWKFKEMITCFDKFYIENLNVLEEKWIYLNEYVTVTHPIYEQVYNTRILSIEKKDVKIYFLAVEFSNNVWGIYLKDDYKTQLIKFVLKKYLSPKSPLSNESFRVVLNQRQNNMFKNVNECRFIILKNGVL